MYVDLAVAKQHLKMTTSHRDDEIELKLGAAEEHVQNILGASLDSFLSDDSPAELPRPIVAAILLYLGDMVDISQTKVMGVTIAENTTARDLLYPYRQQLGA